MDNFTNEQLDFIHCIGNAMLRDGITPDMFVQFKDDLTKAYMTHVIKVNTDISNSFLTNSVLKNNLLHSLLDTIDHKCS